MEGLSVDLQESIGQYFGLTFPTDEDVLMLCHRTLCQNACDRDLPGQLKVLLPLNQELTSDMAIAAVMNGSEACLELLIAANCPKDSTASLWALNRDCRCLELLIEAGYPMEEIDLEMAAEGGYDECLKLLLAADCPMDKNAIIEAARNGHTECLKLLLAADCPMDTDAIFEAVEYARAECLELLLAKIDPFLEGEELENAILGAAIHGRIKCLTLLIGKIDDNDTLENAVLGAATFGASKCLKLLLDNDCPIHHNAIGEALRNENIKCYKLLIDKQSSR